MLEALGNGYLILAEFPVEWMPTAQQIPKEDSTAMYPVWMMDAAGTRAAIFVRCPACYNALGLSPGNELEQKQWNQEYAIVTTMVGCEKCQATYMMTQSKGYLLSMIPPQKQVTLPRLWMGVAQGE